VYVVDISKPRIAAWNSDRLPIYEPGLDDVVSNYTLPVLPARFHLDIVCSVIDLWSTCQLIYRLWMLDL
ncbi:unnamed protein product, partial [Closterium sp. NIES-53]